ncbi:MAG TPA: tail fiber protein [Methylocystis sp.]|nr:tail fiber protein [Methylocystis sp.]
MSTPFLGMISLFPFGYAPKGWALCNGQLLPINQNQALFALLGTTYGGDGRVNFALPNLQGSIPVSFGVGSDNTIALGQIGGEASHTLSLGETPAHNHLIMTDAATPAINNTNSPGGNVLGQSVGVTTPTSGPKTQFGVSIYSSSSPSGALNAATIDYNGGSQPHENRMPYLVLNYCIALQGIFPSQN